MNIWQVILGSLAEYRRESTRADSSIREAYSSKGQ